MGTFRFEDESLKERFPNAQDRIEFRHAQTLAHELVHAAILIDGQSSFRSDDLNVVAGFRKMLQVANSAGVDKERRQVEMNLFLLLSLLKLHQDDKERDEFIKKQSEVLVEEKYAGQTAKAAFGLSISNELIARLYADDLVRRQERKSKKGKSDDDSTTGEVNRIRHGLRDALKNFFDRIDSELDADSKPASVPK